MKDDIGLYYYPYPENKIMRVYVLKIKKNICFRLWRKDDPELWQKHGWIPWEAIQDAACMYHKKNFDPLKTYDIELARVLLADS